jgi:hypothetical protein
MSEDSVLHDDIREIQRLLEDSYDTGFPILKELIQNASDAKATMLSIGKFDGFGISSTDHPLLQKHPALLIYNNGDFKERDSKNIRYISGGGKANDGTVVGKFGLGLKSIFHLCDIFFYVTRITDGAGKGKLESRQFNPWIENPDAKHSEWQILSDKDHSQLETKFEEISKKCSDKPNGDGFLLIIPLKTTKNDHITDNNIFPDGKGEYFGHYDDIKDRIIHLLPMLNNISPSGTTIKKIIFNLVDYSEKIVYDSSFTSFYKTSIEADFLKNKQRAEEIKKCGLWPKDNKTSSCETAFTLTRIQKTDDTAYLYLDYAVFLPLEQIHAPIPLLTNYSYSIVLHGQFAIDSGRKGIKHFDSLLDEQEDYINAQSVDETYKKWNQFIAQVCMYPYMLKILKKSIHENIIDKNDINQVFSAIKTQFQPHNLFLLKKYNLARNYQNLWELFDSDKNIYLIPQIDLNLRFKDIFKNEINNGKIIVFESFDENEYTFLSENIFNNSEIVIDNFRDDLFLSTEKIDYLIKYIELIKENCDENTFRALFKKISNNFEKILITDDIPQYSSLVCLCNCFNNISKDNNFMQKVITYMFEISDDENLIIKESNLDTMITPLRISQPTITIQEFIKIAKCLENENHYRLLSSLYQDKFYRLNQMESILRNDGSLCIIPVEKLGLDSDIPENISLNMLKSLMSKKLIIQTDKDRKFAKLYWLVTGSVDIYLISSDIIPSIRSLIPQVAVPISNWQLFSDNNIGNFKEDIEDVYFDDFNEQLSIIFNYIPNSLFYKLPIHKVKNKNGYCQIEEGKTYRSSGQKKVSFPASFNPTDIYFIEDNPNDRIREKENNEKIVPVLLKNECIKLFFDGKEKIDNISELEWLLENIDEIDTIRDVLRSKYWIPINGGETHTFVRPVDIFGENIINSSAITVLRNEPYNIQNIYKETDIDLEYRDKIKDKGIFRNVNSKESFLLRLTQEFSIDIPDLSIQSSEDMVNYTEIFIKITNTEFTHVFYVVDILLQNLIVRQDSLSNKDAVFNNFFSKLIKQRNTSAKNYINVLRDLSDQKISEPLKELFCKLLDRLLSADDFESSLLKDICFPTKGGNWQISELVIYDVDEASLNIPLKFRTIDDINQILKSHSSLFGSLNKEEILDDKNIILEHTYDESYIFNYFKKWINQGVNVKLVAFLLYLFRSNYSKVACSDKYNFLSSSNVDSINVFLKENHVDFEMQKSDENFQVRIYEETDGKQMSLAGIRTQFSNDFDYISLPKVGPIFKIRFSSSLNNITDDIIKSLIRKVFDYGYGLNTICFESIFNKIINTNATTLNLTRENLFDDIFSELKHLSLLNDDLFKDRYIEYRQSGLREKDKEIIRVQLKEQLKNDICHSDDKKYQIRIREAIIKHIKKNQYNYESVLYELFQNADDAYNERVLYGNISTLPDNRPFMIDEVCDSNSIIVKYFGREINECYSDNQNSPYGFDLENMLSLSSSYKGKDETGKFGLGFKSVYLVCDEPIIRSGDLHLKILGGFYPETEKQIALDDHETRLELQLNKYISIKELSRNFLLNTDYLVAFSKAIHQIKVNITGNELFESKWLPDKIINKNEYLLEKGKMHEINYLKLTLRMQERNAHLLFRLDTNSQNIVSIDDDLVSKIWNTTPLQNDKGLNFAINADFHVDLGRKTVVKNEHNERLVNSLSEKLGAFLIDIYKNHQKIIQINSVFDVILQAINVSDFEYLRQLPQKVVEIFYEEYSYLPTGFGEIFNPVECDRVFNFPDDHKHFKVRQNKNDTKSSSEKLNELFGEFVKKHIPRSCFIKFQAYQCYPNEIKSQIERVPINDIFDLLEYIPDWQISPTILEDFCKFYKLVSLVKPQTNMKCKFLFKDGTFKQANETFNLDESLSDEYSSESIDVIKTYWSQFIYRINKEILVKPSITTLDGLISDFKKNYSEQDIKIILEYYVKEEEEEFDPTIPVNEPFPTEPIKDNIHLDGIQKYIQEIYNMAAMVKYERRWRRIRTSRGEDKKHIGNRYRKHCQMCKKISPYWEITEIFTEPDKEINEMNLSFCPECAAKYRLLRNKNSIMLDFQQEILNADINGELIVSVGDEQIHFTAIHLAEIQKLLQLKQSDNNMKEED